MATKKVKTPDEIKKETNEKNKIGALNSQKLDELYQILSKLKNNNSNSDKNFPINNSNILQVDAYIDAFTKLKSFVLPYMWGELKYFENLLQFEGDEFLELYGHRIAQQAILNGCVAIVEDKKGKVMMGSSPIETDGIGNVIKGKVFLSPMIIGSSKMPEWIRNKYENKEIVSIDAKGEKTGIVFWKWNSLGLTMLFEFLPFIEVIGEIISLMNINIPASMFKWLVEVRNDSGEILKHEIKGALNNTTSNMIFKIKPNSYQKISLNGTTYDMTEVEGDSNKWEPVEISRHPNEFSREDLAIFTNIMNYITGHFCNINQKKERNINAEVDINNAHFELIQLEYLREAKIFVSQYNQAYDKTASVKFSFDLKDNEEKEVAATQGKDVDYE